MSLWAPGRLVLPASPSPPPLRVGSEAQHAKKCLAPPPLVREPASRSAGADTVGIRAVYYVGGVLLLLAAAIGFTASRATGPAR